MRRGLELHDEPAHAASNYYWLSALLGQAQKQGMGALLTGQYGNGTVSWTGGPVNLWALLGTSNWTALREEFKKLSGREWSKKLYYLLRDQVLRPIVVQGRYLRKCWQQQGQEPWENYAAINRDWSRSLDLTKKMLAEGHDPYFRRDNSLNYRLKIIRPDNSILGHLWAQSSAGYSLEVRDPTVDIRLMKFCLAVPNNCYYRLGKSRLLLRESLAGLMPPQVLWNPRKGVQAADIGHRVLKNVTEVEETLRQLDNSALGRAYLDLPKMQRVLDSLKVKLSPENWFQTIAILLRGLMVGIFLLKFEQKK